MHEGFVIGGAAGMGASAHSVCGMTMVKAMAAETAS